MSNPDQPGTPPLTRKQLRELRQTGTTPVIDENSSPDADATEPPAAAEQASAPVAPLAQAAEPAPVSVAPAPDTNVDLGVSPLTRRQAREQERIRTASVPVISPVGLSEPASPQSPNADALSSPEGELKEDAANSGDAADAQPIAMAAAHLELESEDEEADAAETSVPAVVVNPALGQQLLDGGHGTPEMPPSFDQLIARSMSSTGAVGSPNALILSQAPTAGFSTPISATGELLVTGTFDLPEGLGSRGHALGTTDGKEADAVLLDGELLPASSPTPIAASAAISTVKTNDEIIRPPAPEKGNRLMFALAITAGALALALVGVLIVAFATGVFS